jgi:DNA polymerase III subunit delta'
MSFASVQGQEPAIQTLTRALESGRVHHAYRFEGPAGVGKEKTAFLLARALVCETGARLGCGECSACRRALSFGSEEPRLPLHPDVVLVQRGLYPPALLGGSASEATGISVEQIRRVVLTRAAYRSHEHRALVFIVRDAEELTASAANALLKTLEEPPPHTHFILLTSRPHRLLDTIRSRTLPLRFGPLPDQLIGEILERHGLAPAHAALAQGSASHALALADPEGVQKREDFLQSALDAIAAPDLAHAIGFADTKSLDRHELYALLGFVAQSFASQAREKLAQAPASAERLALHHELVVRAMSDLEKNGQPALVIESMLTRLRRV